MADVTCGSLDQKLLDMEGIWIQSDQPCSDHEIFLCEKVTYCCKTIYCRLVPDPDTGTDTDTDTDSQTSSDTSTVSECQTGNTTIEWHPNPPSDYDCGPGCKQVVFEEPNTIVGYDVKGNYIAYASLNDPVGQARIVDLQSNCTAEVVHPEFDVEQSGFGWPNIDGERVVFRATKYAEVTISELFLIDILTGDWQRHLTNESPPNPFYSYRQLGLQGNIVAFFRKDDDGANGQAFYYSLVDNSMTTISSPDKELWGMTISGDYVVWTDNQWGSADGPNADIYAHRISAGVTWNLSDDPAGQFAPRIDGTKVVWTDLRHSGGSYTEQGTWDHADIFMYDFTAEQLTEITNQDWLQLYPDIEGDRIVWQDSRDCFQPNNTYDWSNIHIWMYDLSTGQEHQITDLPGAQSEARIDGDRVFFLAAHPDGYYAIFMQDLAALGL